MNQNQRKFVRCFNCKIKPATIKCFDCNENEPTKLCYHCDSALHPDQDHQKQIIPYDQMVTNEERTRSVTPEQIQQDVTPHLSSILKSRIKKNEENTNIINDECLNKNQLKSVELKFRIKFQEQENTINLLKQHIENIETKHKENLSKMRDQLIKAQDDAFRKQEENINEINKLRKSYEDKIQQYVQQVDSETQFNNSLQNKLEELRYQFEIFRNTHQIKLQEAQQTIAQLRAEIERRKYQEETIQIESENQVIQIKKESQQEMEKNIAIIKNDCILQIEENKQKLQGKQEQINSLQQQISQLQQTLKEIEAVWQKKIQFEQQQYEELRLKYNTLKDDCDTLIKDVKNLQSEIMIYQKENELFQKEKLSLTKQLNQLLEKNEKMDRFIYGSKKSQTRIKI